MEDAVAKLIEISDDKKIVIEMECYGVCCTAVPKYNATIKLNGETITSSSIELDRLTDALLVKALK